MERDEAYLLDIREAASLALQYIADTNETHFQQNIQLQDSVIRRLEIIGEAAKRISSVTKAKYPTLPWVAMIGMRNLMIHEYDNIDVQIVWNTVKHDLPDILRKLS